MRNDLFVGVRERGEIVDAGLERSSAEENREEVLQVYSEKSSSNDEGSEFLRGAKPLLSSSPVFYEGS